MYGHIINMNLMIWGNVATRLYLQPCLHTRNRDRAICEQGLGYEVVDDATGEEVLEVGAATTSAGLGAAMSERVVLKTKDESWLMNAWWRTGTM